MRRLLVLALVLGALGACTKTPPVVEEDTLELKEDALSGFALRLPKGATMRIDQGPPGTPIVRVFSGDGFQIEVTVAERSGPSAVTSLDEAVQSIPPAGMARPIERMELPPNDFLVVTMPKVGSKDVWVWRHGTQRFVRARCLGPEAALPRLKEICTSLREID